MNRQRKAPRKTVRLLTIGNSFADNAATFLEALAAADGRVCFEIGRANLGGCSLEKHWNLACLTHDRPQCKIYRWRTPAAREPEEVTLQEALARRPWDAVTLQQASMLSWRRSSYQPYLDNLFALVRRLAPRAEILLHQTWAYRADAPFLAEHGLSQERMFAAIQANYRLFGSRLGCRILPVGDALQRARRTPGHRFRWPDPDYEVEHALPPDLPRQDHSLAVGWKWSVRNTPDGIPRRHLDARHLNAAGCYLAGCVWFEVLTQHRPRAAFRPPGMTAVTAAWLRATAHAAVGDEARRGRT